MTYDQDRIYKQIQVAIRGSSIAITLAALAFAFSYSTPYRELVLFIFFISYGLFIVLKLIRDRKFKQMRKYKIITNLELIFGILLFLMLFSLLVMDWLS